MNNIARSSCVVCHVMKPRTEMRLRTFYEHSGGSAGVSTNPKRKNSTRLSGRSYYRAKSKWVCDDCWRQRPNYFSTIILALIANPIFIPKYKGYSSLKSFFYFITVGGFFLGWLGTILAALVGSLRNSSDLPNSRIL